jgi:multidrug resistance efflux pump
LDVAEDSQSRQWSALSGGETSAEFCQAWLALQCQMIPSAAAGLLLLESADQVYAPAASWPDPRRDISALKGAATEALLQRRGIVLRPKPDLSSEIHVRRRKAHIAYPILVDDRIHGVVVVDVLWSSDDELRSVLRQLHWGTGRLEALFARRQGEEDSKRLARVAIALDAVVVAQGERKLQATAMAVVNELATRLKCSRVSIGLIKRNRVRLLAMSHSAWFQKTSQLVAAIENAMEEALDQRGSVALPPVAAAGRRLAVAHRDLAAKAGVAAVASLVMTSRGRPIGTVTLERREGEAFSGDEIAVGEAVAGLVGPVIEQKVDARCWFAGRLVDAAEEGLNQLVSPRRPALKLAAAAAVAVLSFVALAEGEHRVAAKAVVEGAVQRAAVVPFDGYVVESRVRAGDTVRKGDVVAALDDKDLRLEETRWRGEAAQLAQKYRDAAAKHDRATMGVLAAQATEAEAQLGLIEAKLLRSRITAPFDGVVVSGDLSQKLGSPVEKGQVLFEITPLDAYRVILEVDERDIAAVALDQHGQLVLAGLTREALGFKVSKITSVATAEEGRNFFRVEASLDQADVRVRPGMEGVGKVVAGERKLLWIWTHSLLDWLRLSLWKWLP